MPGTTANPFVVLIDCILPMISPQEELSQVSKGKIKVSDIQLLSDKSDDEVS